MILVLLDSDLGITNVYFFMSFSKSNMKITLEVGIMTTLKGLKAMYVKP
jgi:hypothetical protein